MKRILTNFILTILLAPIMAQGTDLYNNNPHLEYFIAFQTLLEPFHKEFKSCRVNFLVGSEFTILFNKCSDPELMDVEEVIFTLEEIEDFMLKSTQQRLVQIDLNPIKEALNISSQAHQSLRKFEEKAYLALEAYINHVQPRRAEIIVSDPEGWISSFFSQSAREVTGFIQSVLKNHSKKNKQQKTAVGILGFRG